MADQDDYHVASLHRNLIIETAIDSDLLGDIIFKTGGVERARINKLGVGTGLLAAAGGTINTTSAWPLFDTKKYIVYSSAPGVYKALNVDGTLHNTYTDTATTSGLKALLSDLAADGVHFHFASGRFQFLDCPTGTESFAGALDTADATTGQDHASFTRIHGLTFSGEGLQNSIVSNRTNQIAWGSSVQASQFTESGTTVTVTTVAAHGLRVGMWVQITNCTPTGYNGTFQILSVPTATTFTYTATASGLTTPATVAGKWSSGLQDTEPFSFTNCNNVKIIDLGLESCGRAKSTTDCIDLDDGVNTLVQNVRIMHSRARAMTIDGGYNGQWAGRAVFRDNFVLGRPMPPQMIALAGGSLVASETHQYVVTWVLNDLGVNTVTAATYSAGTYTFTVAAVPQSVTAGQQINVVGMFPDAYNGSFRVSAVTATTITVDQFWGGTAITNPGLSTSLGTLICADETKPSDPTPFYTDTTNKTARIYLRPGPYNCIAQRIYRWDNTTAAWKLVVQTANNAWGVAPITQYDDSAAPAGLAAAVFGHRSSIQDSGIEVMASQDCLVTGNLVDGVGDALTGANGYGVNVVRKLYGPTANPTQVNLESLHTKIFANSIKQTALSGIRIFGGSDGLAIWNIVGNSGTVTTVGGLPGPQPAIKVDCGAPAPNSTSDRNLIIGNVAYDDQSASTWSGGATTKWAVQVTAGCNDTVIKDNNFKSPTAFTSGKAVTDAGTNTVIRGNKGFVTANKGTQLLSNAATSATVSHGLDTTPAAGDIVLTILGPLGSTKTAYVSGTPGQTTFVIALDAANSSGSITVAWAVDTSRLN